MRGTINRQSFQILSTQEAFLATPQHKHPPSAGEGPGAGREGEGRGKEGERRLGRGLRSPGREQAGSRGTYSLRAAGLRRWMLGELNATLRCQPGGGYLKGRRGAEAAASCRGSRARPGPGSSLPAGPGRSRSERSRAEPSRARPPPPSLLWPRRRMGAGHLRRRARRAGPAAAAPP